MTNPTSDLRESILATPHTRAVLRTDKRGTVLSVDGISEDEARALGTRADLALAAVRRLGRTQNLGAPRTLLVEFEEALLVSGAAADGSEVVVLAGREANVGLLLSRLRRLLESDVRPA
jgi:hypothetical protein